MSVEAVVVAEPDDARRQDLEWALGVAARKAEAGLSEREVSAAEHMKYAQADELVLSKLRARIGLDRVKWAVSGAAPIPAPSLV